MKNIFICTLFSVLVAFPALAWRESHGGDGAVFEFKEISQILLKDILALDSETIPPELRSFPHRYQKIAVVLDIRSVDFLYREGVAKDAVNYPTKSPPVLIINQTRWSRLSYKQKEKLALHEMLHLAHYNDSDYAYSMVLFGLLDERARQSPTEEDIGQVQQLISDCRVKELSNHLPQLDLYQIDRYGKGLLHYAIEAHCSEAVKLLLGAGASSAKLLTRGLNPHFLAVVSAQRNFGKDRAFAEMLHIIKVLSEAGADVNTSVGRSMDYGVAPFMNCQGETSLHRAVNGYDRLHVAHSQKLLRSLLRDERINLSNQDSCLDTVYERAITRALAGPLELLLDRASYVSGTTLQRLKMLVTYNPWLLSWDEIAETLRVYDKYWPLNDLSWMPAVVESYLQQSIRQDIEPGVRDVILFICERADSASVEQLVLVVLRYVATSPSLSHRMTMSIVDLLTESSLDKEYLWETVIGYEARHKSVDLEAWDLFKRSLKSRLSLGLSQ